MKDSIEIFFVLENIRSCFNVGSIFRTASALGYKIHLIGITPTPSSNNKLEKTALSTTSITTWFYFKNTDDWLSHIKKTYRDQRLVISIENIIFQDKTIDLFQLIKKAPFNPQNYKKVFICLGHEINGISQKIIAESNFIVQIPTYGPKKSLNVATCAGIAGYFIKYTLLHH